MTGVQSTPTIIPSFPRTLIADDEPDILTALRLLLKSEGHQTETVSSPAGVLEAITHAQFDVVLMDLNYARDTTSGREGLDLISRIHALDPLLPIIVMTAWGSVDLAVETMRRGVRDFVQKPWDNSRLLQTLNRQVKQARVRRTVYHRQAKDHETELQLKNELAEARELQESLLSESMPALPGFQITARWQPATTVGGDYVAAFKINERHAAVCVADVAGKGLPAALLMSNFQAALKTAALEDHSPGVVCTRLNRLLRSNIPLHKFVTAFYGVIDVHERALAFTNAGHNSPLLLRQNGNCARLEVGGSVLGVFAESFYGEAEVKLESGDRLILFTDGLTEAMNDKGELFGEEGLLDLLCENSKLGASDLQQLIFTTARDFCDNTFHDDATLMVVVVE
jgi:sigma-B regulation protein RsbU (phosphoserine phosphatase)